MRNWWKVAIVLVAVVPVVGCGAVSPQSPTPTPSVTNTPTYIDAPEADDLEETATLADLALRAYLNRLETPDRWIDALSPYLGRDALYAYSTVDPMRVPEAEIEGSPVLVQGNATAVAYLIPTTIGQWRVQLVREGEAGSSRWVVDRFVQPEGAQ